MVRIYVLRLGHRIFRDQRITTHCALVARAFGANGMFYTGQRDATFENSVKKVCEEFGGNFEVKYVPKWKSMLNEWKSKGKIVHLTMYGLPLERKIKKIGKKDDLMVIIGGEKVPPEVYHLSDWNISVTNQPHSEVAALALFLDRYFEGKEMNKKFKNAKLFIIPQERGKKVMRTDAK
jgi:tRNA (cytidine56-2'-O)-methyltransferase